MAIIRFTMTAVISVMYVSALFAQNQIQGTITSDLNEPLPYANIILYNSKDSTLTKGSVSDGNGSFKITPVNKGTYFLTASMVGYKSVTISDIRINDETGSYDAGILILGEGEVLNEVTITAQKPMIEVLPDKIVFNVDSSPSAAGSNGLELLSRAPGVTVDMDNNIQLLGKGGVRIFINGRPSRISGTDLVNLLQNMNADNIQNIEIISNPSSKYEASGNAGIINITMKKSLDMGFNGNINSSVSQGNYLRQNNGLALNYSKEKFRASLGVTQSDQDIQDNFLDTRDQNSFSMGLDSKQVSNVGSFGLRGDIEFYLGDKQTINISGNTIWNQNDDELFSNTTISQNNQINSILFAESHLDRKSTNFNYNINYNFAINKTANLSSELSLGKFSSDGSTNQPNRYTEADGETLISNSDRNFDSNTDIDLLSFKVDFEKSWDKYKFSTGGKYVSIITDNEFTFFNLIDLEPEIDPDKSNDFEYTERVFALYGILDIKLTEFTRLNAGVRMENTSSRGLLTAIQQIENTDVSRRYTNFFPNVGISYNDNKKHALNLNVGRRISRPDYQNLNPFESPQSELSTWKGNPFLNPSYTMNYQVVYSYKQRLTITNQYSVTTDFFANLIEISGEQGNVIIPRNMSRITNYASSITYPFNITDNWEVVAMLNGSYNTYSGLIEGVEIDINNYNGTFSIQNNLKLPGKINLELSYNIGSQWIWRGSILVEGNSNLRFGVRRDFFKNQLQVRITGSDILYTGSNYYYYGNYGGIVIDGVRTFDNRRFGVSATLKFGNQKLKTLKKREGGLSDELNRL